MNSRSAALADVPRVKPRALQPAQLWARCTLRGLDPAGTAQPGLSKSSYTFSPFFLTSSPPSRLPLLLSVTILGTPDPRQQSRITLFFLFKSCHTWSLLPRSPASCSCQLNPWEAVPEERSWESYCVDKLPTISSAVILKMSYKIHLHLCALQGTAAIEGDGWYCFILLNKEELNTTLKKGSECKSSLVLNSWKSTFPSFNWQNL